MTKHLKTLREIRKENNKKGIDRLVKEGKEFEKKHLSQTKTKPLLEKWKRSEAIKDHIICQNCGKVNQSLNTAGIIISLIESDLKKAIDDEEKKTGYSYDTKLGFAIIKQKIFGSAEKEVAPEKSEGIKEREECPELPSEKPKPT